MFMGEDPPDLAPYSQISTRPPEMPVTSPPWMSNSRSSSASSTDQIPAFGVGWPSGYGSRSLPQLSSGA